MQLIKIKKGKVSTNRKRKNKDKTLVGRQRPENKGVDLEEQTGELMVMVWLVLHSKLDNLLCISIESEVSFLVLLFLPLLVFSPYLFPNAIRWRSGQLSF